MTATPPRIRLTEVSPRDGLQNEPLSADGPIATARKIDLVRRLLATGVDEIEVSSFVNPKLIPQLADAAEVFSGVAPLLAAIPLAQRPVLSALVPNARGLAALLHANEHAAAEHRLPRLIGKASVFTAASDTFAEKNIGATIDDSIDRFRPVVADAKAAGLEVRGYVSCAIACPYEGPIEPLQVARVVRQLLAIGVDEIDVADTIGVATTDTIAAMLDEVINALEGRHSTASGNPALTVHLHDTSGRAADCALAAADLGVRSFDSAAAGLGGCPFASTPHRRAPGNIATGLLVGTLKHAGFAVAQRRDIDHDALAIASVIAAGMTTRPGT